MATREELLEGLRFVPAQANRIARMLDAANEWDVKREAGWTPKEMFIHVSTIMGMMPVMGPSILKGSADADIVEGIDMAEFNERGVASMRSLDPHLAVEAIATTSDKLADWVNSLTDEQLESQHKFRGMPMSMSDFLMTATVMHAFHHLFEAPLSVAL